MSSFKRRFSCGIRGLTSVGSCKVAKISARSFARVAANVPFCSNVCFTAARRSSNVLIVVLFLFSIWKEKRRKFTCWSILDVLSIECYVFHHQLLCSLFYRTILSFLVELRPKKDPMDPLVSNNQNFWKRKSNRWIFSFFIDEKKFNFTLFSIEFSLHFDKFDLRL